MKSVSLEILKTQLDVGLSNQVGCPFFEQEIGLYDLWRSLPIYMSLSFNETDSHILQRSKNLSLGFTLFLIKITGRGRRRREVP